MKEINDPHYWQMLQRRVSERHAAEAFAFFRRAGIEPILIKGWAAARFYDESDERYFTDVDLMFAPEEFERAVKINESFDGRLPVDLHKGARHLDALPFAELYKNSILVKCGETEIRVLCAEDNLRFLCVHWLTDGGENRRRLWDIYYAVKNRPADFGWERCLNVVSATRRRWIVTTIALAHKYLGLPVRDLPFAVEISEIPGWITGTVEKEWANYVILTPLHQCLKDRQRLWQQVRKRFPPNPIQATIDMEGEFDDKSRLYYQVGNIFRRLKPSVARIFGTVLTEAKRRITGEK